MPNACPERSRGDKYLKSVQFIESLLNNPGPNYLKSSDKKDRSFFIKRTRFLLNLLDNPEKNFKYIHIAGTSGKSSLTCLLQSILTKAKITTGAYFSPHPTETFERIKVNHHYISPTDFTQLTRELKPYLSKCAVQNPYGVPSYFETLLALALLYFKKQKCQYVILETGLGGAYDATNIIPKPEIAIITKIDLDHTDILGNTKEKIARDKAGIIKKGSLVITAEQDPKILKIFQKICKQKNCQFHQVNFDYKLLKNDLSGTKFKYQGQTYETKLPGEHQIQNAVLAVETVKQLNNIIPPEGQRGLQSIIKSGLANAFISCRLEVVSRRPVVILDGAHNPDKMKSTAEFIKGLTRQFNGKVGAGIPARTISDGKVGAGIPARTISDKINNDKNNKKSASHPNNPRLHLILALAENKDLYNTLKYIVPLAQRVYLTRFLIPGRKSQDLKKMYRVTQRLTKNKIEIFIDPRDALNQVLQSASKNDIILVTGSFFLAGELGKAF